MQSKLNEILELCIEKSQINKEYWFRYYPLTHTVEITIDSGCMRVHKKFEADQALEYMQNE